MFVDRCRSSLPVLDCCALFGVGCIRLVLFAVCCLWFYVCWSLLLRAELSYAVCCLLCCRLVCVVVC